MMNISGKEHLVFWTIMNEWWLIFQQARRKQPNYKDRSIITIYKTLIAIDAILPILFADGTFQSPIYRSTMIFVIVISKNRTNIQIAWGWLLSQNSKILT